LRKTLLKNKTVLCLFFEKSFQYFPCEVFFISSLESWNQASLDSWILLTQSWNHSLGLFVIIFVIIKTTWINLIHHHEACFYTTKTKFPTKSDLRKSYWSMMIMHIILDLMGNDLQNWFVTYLWFGIKMKHLLVWSFIHLVWFSSIQLDLVFLLMIL